MTQIEAIGASLERQRAGLAQKDLHPCLYTHAVQPKLSPFLGIKNIIAVASGKGGVGKSTVAFHLAHHCALSGLKVGLLDADIYGPSLPVLSGIHARPLIRPEKKFEPHYAFGMKMLSIGHLVDEQEALIWRGPMATGALMQLFTQTSWGRLDVLFVDLPPGTGDILLTLCQKIPLAGVVMVRNLHPLAHADYRRAVTLFDKMGVAILGDVINQQAPIELPLPDHQTLRLLGVLSFSKELYASSMHHQPVSVYAGFDNPCSQELQLIAEHTIDALSLQPLHQAISLHVAKN